MAAIIRSITPAAFLVGVVLVGSVIGRSAKVEGSEAFSIAQLQQKHSNTKCSQGTVKGRYAFALPGTVAIIGPLAASGTTTFDGKGLVNIMGFVNTANGEPAFNASIDGTYSVNSKDCTGTAIFKIPAPGIFDQFTELRFEGVIVNRGEEIRYLITTPGVVFAGNSVRQLVMTKAGQAASG